MRNVRTSNELWAINEFLTYLSSQEEGWVEDSDFIDRPDLVIENKKSNVRIACEFSMIHLGEWYRWKNDPHTQLDLDAQDTFIIPREPNLWISEVIKRKNNKIKAYKKNANASEVWLIVHSVEMKIYDLFTLDKEYDLPLLQDATTKATHGFSRIYVVSANAGTMQVFPPNPDIGPAPKLIPGVLKQLKVQAMTNAEDRGKTVSKSGDGFISEGKIVLSPLGDDFL